jgi:DNA-binding NarL/FixJ family response regulator
MMDDYYAGPLTALVTCDRERRVLRLAGEGRTASEIAEQLALSPNTVSTYRARVLEKLQLGNNAELTVYAIRNNLV